MKHRIKSLLTALILAGMAMTGLGQSNLYVATNGADNSDADRGQSWALPYATISNGIAHAATAGDAVWVSNGVYILSATLSITRAITVSAWSVSSADTIIDGNAGRQCVSISAAATLCGFTISNGAISGDGGGVSLANASCVVTNCLITRNRTTGGNGRGGGIYLSGGKVTDCVISHNVSTSGGYPYGGGGLFCSQSYGSVINCQFISNSHAGNGWGGGIGTYSVTPSLIVSNCTFDSNIANGGGGVYIYGSKCQFIDCAFSNNMATNGSGGGLYLMSGDIVSNCVFVRNRASGASAGIYLGGGTGVNCVISENLGYGGVGGVEVLGGASLLNSSIINNTNLTGGWGYPAGVHMRGTTTRSTLRNCLIAGNVITNNYGTAGIACETNSVVQNCTIVFNRAIAPGSGNIGGAALSTNSFGHHGNIIYYNTGVYQANWNGDVANYYMLNTCTTPTNKLIGTGNITNVPQFVDTNVANYRLITRSPCVNAGLNQDWMTNAVDRDGRARVRYGTVDMGAYEVIWSGFVFSAY